MLAKMKPARQGASRIAIIFNRQISDTTSGDIAAFDVGMTRGGILVKSLR
jgi:hypothetical protein